MQNLTVGSLQDMTMPVITDVQDQEMTGNRPLDILRGIFHLKQFRSCQQEAIESIVSGQNTVLIMPTGGGKTVCYAVPALMEPKITVVIFLYIYIYWHCYLTKWNGCIQKDLMCAI